LREVRRKINGPVKDQDGSGRIGTNEKIEFGNQACRDNQMYKSVDNEIDCTFYRMDKERR
jgi:hypothetical protein